MYYTVKVTGKATSAALLRWVMFNKETTQICGLDETENEVFVMVKSSKVPPKIPQYKKLQVIGKNRKRGWS